MRISERFKGFVVFFAFAFALVFFFTVFPFQVFAGERVSEHNSAHGAVVAHLAHQVLSHRA